eukprot:CAMPEP_0116147914 /NCGR_PEP_ID=MMETSP0329-20121206/18040_1 /TAXON_ID=697910 /ORGANISM="Pseudo-nitzschia arenysensis, Strain B593" /LENGTH=1026 /DNA_ID=CAMNT_0003643937 /DNA_START=226 /DNA_END=3306 /DNA_ORIENTATION=-
MSSIDKITTREEAGKSLAPSPTYSNDNIRVVHTISSSASFDSSSGANNNVTTEAEGTANADADADADMTVVRVSPTSLQINRSFSENNLAGKPRRTNSIESFASGELILSDSNDSQGLQQTVSASAASNQQRQQSFASSPASSFEEVVKTDSDSSEEDDLEEDDSEVLLAKEMALAIAKNPSMTPAQLRELQNSVQQKVQQKSRQKAAEKEEKKKRKKTKKLRISLEMKAAYKETKLNAKKAYEEIERNTKAGANHIKKQANKGLRAAGLKKQSSSTSSDIAPQTRDVVEAISAHTTTDSSTSPRAAPDVGEDKIRLAGTIWKRRSGLGKYSMTAPWERRRVVLQGSRLIYYKTQQESASDEDDDEEQSTSEHHESTATATNTPGLIYGISGSSSGDNPNWMNTFMDKAGVSMPWESSQSFRGARGYLDLRKEKASASASYGHTGAPTPFALSIKVATTTKYKFCFETQQELMQWLSAITDVVVAGSVDAYNAEILEANDPSAHGDTVSAAIASSTGITWQEPSPRNATAAASREEGRGHQLWVTESYQIASDNVYGSTSSKSRPIDMSNFTSSTTSTITKDTMDFVGASSKDYVVDASTRADFVAIPNKYMEPAIYLVNAVILAARAETALTNEAFWYLLVFFNLLGVLVVRKVQLGGSVKLKPELEATFGQRRIPKIADEKSKFDPVLATIQSAESNDTGVPSLVDENFVPPAGSTSMKIENPKDLPTKDGVIFPGWMEVDASDLMIRGVGYKTNKTKVPCPNSLYRCVELDIFESKARVPDMAGRVILPTVNFDDGDKPKTWNAPDQFVITVALPTDPPKLYGGSANNGGGYTITMYCVMRQETRDILRRVTAEGYNPAADNSDNEASKGDPNKSMVNAAKLFDEWCRRAPSDDNWMARFKVVPQGNNLAEIGLPAWISNYNGKPFLIKRPGTTGFLYRHPDKSCMEFDVSLHPFPYLAKQGICYMKDGFFKKILATLAFCIEGRADDELPECLIGLFQLCYPNPIHATQAEDFFAGKSSRSK